ncbi:transcriptional regulator [Methylobacterium sp. B4]|uniref:tetratricopeptide repeat protein n=1 Tax=Methylobacterium sp. B4 TaxID=1938755 RepID=UPI000D75DC97|nr:transcriptional regulator [Methylobacterium sp. B4]PXW63019.1 TolB-like protein [Methylobacterium sp. B4]
MATSSLPLPDRPSVAVLPFANPEGDFDAQALADGLSEHVTDALACTPGLFVSARNSAFTFKGRTVPPEVVAGRLGVAHVLTGTLSRIGTRLRVQARLHRAADERPIWLQDLDEDEGAVHALRGRIVAGTVAAIAPDLTRAAAPERTEPPLDAGVYGPFLSAYSNHAMPSPESVELRIASIEAVRRLVPEHPLPYALLAQCYTNRVVQGWSADAAADCAEGARLARLALERDEGDPAVLMMAGHTLAFLAQDYDTALGLLDRSLALNPNAAAAYERSGWVRCYVGEPELAADHFHAAKRQSPLDPNTFRFDSGLGLALCMAGAHEEALAWLDRSMAEDPGWTSTHRVRAASLALLGRQEEAQAAADRFMDLEPSYRVARAMRLYRPSPGKDRFVEGMRRAGVPFD